MWVTGAVALISELRQLVRANEKVLIAMTLGQGFRTKFRDYTLLVEIREAGWEARIRDTRLQKWRWREEVSSADAGKISAISMLQQMVDEGDKEEVEKLEWENYGPE